MRRSIKSTLVSILGAAIGFVSSASATDYYVNQEGNDSNDGKTIQTAWLTLNKVNGAPLQPGDIVRLKDTFNHPLETTCSGTVAAPIIFTSYGEEKAKIVGSAVRGPGLSIYSNRNIIFRNLDISSPQGRGILINSEGQGSENIVLEGINIHDCKNNGIDISNPKDSNITLLNCTIEKVGGYAFESSSKGAIILRGNRIKGNGLHPAIKLENVQKAIVENNEISTAVAPKPIFYEMDRKPAFYIADRNKWDFPGFKTMYEGFVVNKTPMSLSSFRKLTGQHGNDNRPGAGISSTLALPQPNQPNAPQAQPTYQTPQGLVDPRTQPGWNTMNKFVQWNVWKTYTNALEQLKQKK